MRQKKVTVLISEELLCEIDKASCDAGMTRSEFLRRAAEEKCKKISELSEGYEKNGQINLSYAEMCLDADNDQLSRYEEKISESD